jgi:hypothetical protein
MKRSVAVLGLTTLLTLAACATMAGPRTFRFTSNRKVPEARACALLVLRRHGFRLVPDSTRPDSAAAVRPDSTAVVRPDSAAVVRRDTAAVVRPDTTFVLIRRPELSEEQPRAWARAEVTVGTSSDGETVVTSVLGSSRHERGPFAAPSAELEDIGSEITARCMW